jgi:hypothetical protein
MNSTIKIFAAMALILSAMASPMPSNVDNGFIAAYLSRPLGNETTSNANLTAPADDPAPHERNTTSRDVDKVPLGELPECYRECIAENCCNAMWVVDVRDLSTQDFCWTMRFSVERWMLDHLAYCVGPKCRSCRPQCQKESTQWMKKYCGRG